MSQRSRPPSVTAVRAVARRFWRDTRGNVLVLTAAMLIPLIAVVGSGIDVARLHLANSRLQQACDASSLAGRWSASSGGDTVAITAEAVKYFNFNFPQNTYGTADFTPAVAVSGTTAKVVTVTATTNLPTTIMRTFGYTTMPLSVTCSAKQDYVNTDIVLVLDTTGSMAYDVNGNNVNSGPTSRIVALRAAVLSLYDQLAPVQAQLTAAGMRLRYGIVPYSSTVNVGHLLYDKDPNNIQTTSWYWQSSCNGGNCTYSRNQVSHSSTWLKSSTLWPGCIEERTTTSSITASTTSIPQAAYDLNVDLPATDDPSRWIPYDTNAQTAHAQTACPREAARLATWSRSDLSNYLNGLTADGGTYHDIGMIWGARFLSSAGVFGDSPTSYSGMPVNKYVIFMTDGELDTGPSLYSAYGVEYLDKRVTGGAFSEQDARHGQRFNLMCSAAKNLGASIWVVAFASSLDTSLTNCASNANQASTSANSADLIARFNEIGKNIGALRLTQ